MRGMAVRMAQGPARAWQSTARVRDPAEGERPPQRDAGPTIRPHAAQLFVDTPAQVGHDAACGCTACAGGTATVQRSRRPAPVSGATAVVQRCLSDPTCPHPDPCPVHNAYTHADDPSAQSFVRTGRAFIGEAAMRRQQGGHAPTAGDVRETARQSPTVQRGGAGLDEGLPTDQRGPVATRQLPGEAGVQSGLRGSTDLTVGRSPAGPVAGHTGMFRTPTGSGSTNTSGQAAFHDVRRQPPPATATPQEVVSHYTGRYVDSLAHGPDILGSPNLTGGTPNLLGYGTLEPPAAGGAPHGAERQHLATTLHGQREHVKDRGRTYTLRHSIPAPMSPQRRTDGDFGYLLPTDPPRPSSPLPYFPGADVDEETAHATGWISQPKRHRYEAKHTPRQCAACQASNPLGASHCQACQAPL